MKNDKRPNILLIMTDQQRYDSLGCYGIDAIPTPNLDKLAAEGVMFENCYSNNPVCTPSRASIFTGKFIPDHGVYRLNDILPDDEILFPERLRQSGYQTALIGKLHVSGAVFEINNRNKNDGFDKYEWCHEPALFLDGKFNSYGKWLKKNHPGFYQKLKIKGRAIKSIPPECHGTYWTAEKTMELIRERDTEKPFFFYMSIFDPHNPYIDYPKEAGDLVDMEKLPRPVYRKGESEDKPEGILRSYNDGYMGCFGNFTEDKVMEMKKGYYASVAFIDKQIGRVLDALERQGLSNNTIVIFLSDHGDMLGDHELFAKGAFFYDPGIRVPFIIKYPGVIKPGRRYKHLVQPNDLAATILKVAGFSDNKINEYMPDSKNLFPSITAGDVKHHDHILCLYRGTGLDYRKLYYDPPINATMIRDNKFKLNVYHKKDYDMDDIECELFNMETDPLEKDNLYDNPSYSDVRRKLINEMKVWLIEHESGRLGSRGGECMAVNPKML